MDKTLDLTRPSSEPPSKNFDGHADAMSAYLPDVVQLNWIAPLRHHSPNTRVIGVFIGLLVGVGLFSGFFQKSVIPAIFFVGSAIFLLINSRREPPITEFTVGPLSVHDGHNEYRFSDLKSFWIDYNPGSIKELTLQLKKWYVPYVRIPLTDQDPIQIRAIMLKFVPEVEHEQTLTDVLSRSLGF